MKFNKQSILILLLIVLALASVCWFIRAGNNDESRFRASQLSHNLAWSAMIGVNATLCVAALAKPSGVGCESLAEAVRLISSQDGSSVWTSPHAPNGAIHINPDWNIWEKVATNDFIYSNEICAFVSPPILRTNGEGLVYVGITFRNGMLELTNPPSWPEAKEIIGKKTN